jgi:hypothetical protein
MNEDIREKIFCSIYEVEYKFFEEIAKDKTKIRIVGCSAIIKRSDLR